MKITLKLTLFIISLIILSLACSVSVTGDEAPVVVISLPVEGETVSVGQLVNVVSTSTSDVGLDRVELLVNGLVFATDNLSGAPTNHSSNFTWVPTAEGAVVLGVIGYDTEGNPSEVALRTVQVTAGGAGDAPQPPTDAPPEATTQAATEQTVMCTPPACGANEAYYCPGSCPGGCGITCATFTPTNPPPDTPTFTSPPPTKTFTPSPTNTSMFIVPSLQVIISLQIIQLTSVETHSAQVTIPSGQIGDAVAACPSNSSVVSGGYAGPRDLYVYSNKSQGNSWRVFAQNNALASKTMTVFVRCLTNSSGTTTQYMTSSSISAGQSGNIVHTCPAGSIVTGGGFATQSTGVLPVYNSSMSGNGWQIWAQNNSGGSRQAKVFVLCLSGVNATTSSKLDSLSIPAGDSNGGYNACPSGDLAVGGGYAAQKNFVIYNSAPHPTKKDTWTGYAFNPGATDKAFFNYAVCLSFD
jgi:hypothetical protein